MAMLSKLVLAGVAIMPLGFAGCVYRQPDAVVVSGGVVVAEEPPVARVEVVGVAPSHEHVWANGYWVRRGSNWDWRAGHWERRPHEHAVWTHSHWERHSGGWVMVEGGWH